MDMTSPILPFVCPEFLILLVLLKLVVTFSLGQLKEFVRDTLKVLEITQTTFKQMPHFFTDANLITALCSVYI